MPLARPSSEKDTSGACHTVVQYVVAGRKVRQSPPQRGEEKKQKRQLDTLDPQC